MKISKLFHSLYGVLMFLPLIAIGGSMAFNIINDKSVDNAQVEDIEAYNKVSYETNDIETIDDFVSGRVYRLYMIDNRGLNLDDVTGENFYMDCPLLAYNFSLNEAFTTEFDETTLQSSMVINDVSMYLIYQGTWTFTILFGDYINSNYVASLCEVDGDYDTLDECYFDFIYLEDTYYEYFFNYVGVSLPLFFKACPDTYYYYEELVISRPQDLSDNFYFALEDMANSPYFSWASSGFLVQPFAYIFGLFGVPLNSPIMILLSYWLTISIIWLVFDLIMYVPLLVHSWIDKGVLE